MQDGDKVRLLGAIAPAPYAEEVTPSDSTDDNFASGPCSRLFVGTGGTVAVVMAELDSENAEVVVNYKASDGQYLWVSARRVNETGTSATDIVAEYADS